MSDQQRSEIRNRARNCCEYCRAQAEFSHDPFSAEHIVPTVKGGSDAPENTAWSCLGCNFHKHAALTHIDFVSGEVASLFNPRTEVWEEHFRWEDGFCKIIGRTPTGRATISRLQLNRLGLVNLRAVLLASGKHPPK